MSAERLAALEDELGHRFADRRLLVTALTHRSAGRPHNERLEFLGDSLLGLIVAEALYHRFADADEGELTRLRASLVNRQALAAVAREHGLGEHIRLGEGELKSGGWRLESILANVLEAVIGAAYLDAGLEAVRALVLRMFDERLRAGLQAGGAKDPKTRLQEYLQARRLPLPSYETVGVEGEAHRQRFIVRCAASGLGVAPVTASGSSRRRAEQAAAERLLAVLEADPARAQP